MNLDSYRDLGQYGFPGDPLLDRALGYLTYGKAKTAINNNPTKPTIFGKLINLL